MCPEYDFSDAHRGPVLPPDKSKVRITIRMDGDIIDWFKQQVIENGGGSYQTMINDALRAYMDDQQHSLEDMLRRVVREELERR